MGSQGQALNCAYKRDPSGFEVWRWTDNTITREHTVSLDKSVSSVQIRSATQWIADLFDEEDRCGVFYAGDVASGKVERQWKPPHDVYINLSQASRSGKHIAAWCCPDSNSQEPQHYVRFGLLAPDGGSFDWKASVDMERFDTKIATIHHVVPSDDGAYIAVAGWENGLLMIDALNRKVLWSKKPEGEIHCSAVAFAPDSKHIYAGGTSGVVYQMNTETGKIVSRWWATLSGQSEYGYRMSSVAVSPDGAFVAAGTIPEGLGFLFRADDGRRYTLRHRGATGMEVLSFSPDSTRLATYGYGSREMKIWKAPKDDAEAGGN